MKIRKVYVENPLGRLPQRRKKHPIRKALLTGAACIGLAGGLFGYANYLRQHQPQSSYSEQAVEQTKSQSNETTLSLLTTNVEEQEMRMPSLEEAVLSLAPSADKQYSANLKREYAEENVRKLNSEGLDAYIQEMIVDGKKFYRTLVKMLEDEPTPESPKLQKSEPEWKTGINFASLNDIEKIIYKAVEEYNTQNPENVVDFNLARAVAYCESTYNPAAVARKHYKKKGKEHTIKLGRGLFQLMPKTAEAMGNRTYNEKELLQARTSAQLGVTYLGYLQESPHVTKHDSPERRLELVLAAYNGGEPAIMPSKKAKGLLAYENTRNKGYGQTREYVRRVKTQLATFQEDQPERLAALY